MVVKARKGGSRRSISSAKPKGNQRVSSIIQNDALGSFVEKDMYCNVWDKIGAKKYLRKSRYHCIECSAANSLTAFMLRRPLNSAALVIPTHRRPVKVSDGTSTQVMAWMIDKWKAKTV